MMHTPPRRSTPCPERHTTSPSLGPRLCQCTARDHELSVRKPVQPASYPAESLLLPRTLFSQGPGPPGLECGFRPGWFSGWNPGASRGFWSLLSCDSCSLETPRSVPLPGPSPSSAATPASHPVCPAWRCSSLQPATTSKVPQPAPHGAPTDRSTRVLTDFKSSEPGKHELTSEQRWENL